MQNNLKNKKTKIDWLTHCRKGMHVLKPTIWGIVFDYLFPPELFLLWRAFQKVVEFSNQTMCDLDQVMSDDQMDQDDRKNILENMILDDRLNESNTTSIMHEVFYFAECDKLEDLCYDIRDTCGCALQQELWNTPVRGEDDAITTREYALFKMQRQLIFLKLDFIISHVIEMLNDETITSMNLWKQRQNEIANFVEHTLPSFYYVTIRSRLACPDFQRSMLTNEDVIAELKKDDEK
jgi:hypothetical protein